jgi:uncharacterized protein
MLTGRQRRRPGQIFRAGNKNSLKFLQNLFYAPQQYILCLIKSAGNRANNSVRGKEGMLNPKIFRKQKNSNDFGLFARERIAAGEFIWAPHHSDSNLHIYLTMEEIEYLRPDEKDVFLRYCYQVDRNIFSGYRRLKDVFSDDANFMNHSCDPNSWYDEGHTLLARRDIKQGEEITYDYGSDTTSRDWGFRCTCGSSRCRGVLNRDDWKTLIRTYHSHVMPYIRERMLFEQSSLLHNQIGDYANAFIHSKAGA